MVIIILFSSSLVSPNQQQHDHDCTTTQVIYRVFIFTGSLWDKQRPATEQ